MTRSHDVHLRSDGSIDIEHYRRAAAVERAKALRVAHDRIDDALAAFFRRAREVLLRRRGLRVRTPSLAGR